MYTHFDRFDRRLSFVVQLTVNILEKDIDFGKILEATGWEIRLLLSVKVNVKPMCSFDLKTQSNDILPFLFRNVDQETAEEGTKGTD